MRNHQSSSALVLTLAALNLAIGRAPSQSQWTNLTASATGPSARVGAAAVGGTSSVWLFGGTFQGGFSGETWEWTGQTWIQHSPTASPSPRYSHAMAYDLFRGVVVLFGGQDLGGAVGDTWEWNGATWLQRSFPVHPSARSEHAMTFDPMRQRTVLFGGTTGAGETWEYDGTQWMQPSTAVAPSARRGHCLAYDWYDQRSVLFGGTSGGNETWEWDGATWRQRLPVHSPSARFYAAMCEDVAHGRLLLFSGYPGYPADTWEWDGEDWIQRQPAASPQGRRAAVMAMAETHAAPVLFGGGRASPLQYFGDLQQFDATMPGRISFGFGCAGSMGALLLSTTRSCYTGDVCTLSVDNAPNGSHALLVVGWSDTAWNGTPLPLALDAIGMTNCTLLVSMDDQYVVSAPNGAGSLTIGIPADPALAGVTAYVQAFVPDAGINPFGAIASGAWALTVAVP